MFRKIDYGRTCHKEYFNNTIESCINLLTSLTTLLDDLLKCDPKSLTEKMGYSGTTIREIRSWNDDRKKDIEYLKKMEPEIALSYMQQLDFAHLKYRIDSN